jgi:hypothetical protein
MCTWLGCVHFYPALMFFWFLFFPFIALRCSSPPSWAKHSQRRSDESRHATLHAPSSHPYHVSPSSRDHRHSHSHGEDYSERESRATREPSVSSPLLPSSHPKLTNELKIISSPAHASSPKHTRAVQEPKISSPLPSASHPRTAPAPSMSSPLPLSSPRLHAPEDTPRCNPSPGFLSPISPELALSIAEPISAGKGDEPNIEPAIDVYAPVYIYIYIYKYIFPVILPASITICLMCLHPPITRHLCLALITNPFM